jgi:hypothetical protein
MESEGDLSRWSNCYVSYAGTELRLPVRDRLAESLVVVRGRVVVVVDGVMSIQGDGNTVHKAKNHSHEYFGEEMLSVKRKVFNILKRARS